MTALRPMSTTLVLVRHGQDVDNSRSIINGRRDTPLTDLGRRQALALADDLGSTNIHCVYTSPLKRANQTASIISRRLGIEDPRIEPDLTEREYGILTGRSICDIPTLAQQIFVWNGFRYVIQAHGVEDYPHLWTRAGSVLRKIQERHGGRTVLVVAHNEILSMIRAHCLQRPWEEALLFPPIANCQLVSLDIQP
ncbi:MAG TPA: histidine phosphatase family protein [Terriglobia bacterium]|nr:histidine phosphatase family protein [Terriglobia bacterium]